MHWLVASVGLTVFTATMPTIPSISSFLRYETSFESPVADDCFYDARITGTLMPVRSRFDGDDAVEPDFDIFAHLVCSHMASVHVHERIVHTGPMTRERVEMLISQRATITRENIERRCLVIPTLRFRGENLIAMGVEAHCGSLGW